MTHFKSFRFSWPGKSSRFRAHMSAVYISTFYRFTPLNEADVVRIQGGLEAFAQASGLRGLVLLSFEGINATVSGTLEAIDQYKREVSALLGLTDLTFKDSVGEKQPFHIFKVKVKDEIVSLGKPGFVPEQPVNSHLSPSEWQAALEDPNTVLLDTRNDYEVEIGKFKNAVDFQLTEFNEFPEKLRKSGLAKDKRVLMYCTGGIRCEKAILEMREQGYQDVHQLDGGILNYLKEYPDAEFDGECFVFDYRVAVDQQLQPTKNYKLCPHCGQPANAVVTCVKCTREETICGKCSHAGVTTCSKNCAHHLAIGSGSTRPQL